LSLRVSNTVLGGVRNDWLVSTLPSAIKIATCCSQTKFRQLQVSESSSGRSITVLLYFPPAFSVRGRIGRNSTLPSSSRSSFVWELTTGGCFFTGWDQIVEMNPKGPPVT